MKLERKKSHFSRTPNGRWCIKYSSFYCTYAARENVLFAWHQTQITFTFSRCGLWFRFVHCVAFRLSSLSPFEKCARIGRSQMAEWIFKRNFTKPLLYIMCVRNSYACSSADVRLNASCYTNCSANRRNELERKRQTNRVVFIFLNSSLMWLFVVVSSFSSFFLVDLFLQYFSWIQFTLKAHGKKAQNTMENGAVTILVMVESWKCFAKAWIPKLVHFLFDCLVQTCTRIAAE